MDGDEARQRFTAMYDAYRARVWAYASCQAGRPFADDVVSETFVVAWRRFADIPDPPLPWLLGVARNVARNRLRAETRRGSLAAELRDWTEPGPFAADVGEAVADRLDRSCWNASPCRRRSARPPTC